MGYCILKMDGKFMHWTTVSDSPKSPLLPEDLFVRYLREEFGRNGMVDYANLLDQAKQTGTSWHGQTVDQIIKNNHAGKGGKKMTKAELIEAYSFTEAEFIEWSKGRDKEFDKMVLEFGPERKKK